MWCIICILHNQSPVTCHHLPSHDITCCSLAISCHSNVITDIICHCMTSLAVHMPQSATPMSPLTLTCVLSIDQLSVFSPASHKPHFIRQVTLVKTVAVCSCLFQWTVYKHCDFFLVVTWATAIKSMNVKTCLDAKLFTQL